MSKQALEGKRLNAFLMDPESLIIVGLDTTDGKDHPLYDERINMPLDEAMVLNIMQLGVLETVIVRKDGDAVQVVDGRQRVRHAREANVRLAKLGSPLISVPCLSPIKGTDKHMVGILISANEIRRDDDYRIKAEKALRMTQQFGFNEDECALHFGVHKQTIKQWLAFFDLAPEVQQAVSEGELKPTAATKLAKLSREAQKETLAKVKEDKKAGKKASIAEVEHKTKQAKAGDSVTVHLAPSKRRIREVADALNGPHQANVREALLWVLGDGPAPEAVQSILSKIGG